MDFGEKKEQKRSKLELPDSLPGYSDIFQGMDAGDSERPKARLRERKVGGVEPLVPLKMGRGFEEGAASVVLDIWCLDWCIGVTGAEGMVKIIN